MDGFHLLHETVDRLRAHEQIQDSLTIIYVSDGRRDNTTSKPLGRQTLLRRCGTGFPTFMSMDLRQKYHFGSAAVPPVFLVQQNDDFATSFDAMKELMRPRPKIRVAPPVKVVPWGDDIEEVREGTIVLVSVDRLLADGIEYEVARLPHLDMLDAAFRMWLQELQLISLRRGADTKQMLDRNGNIALEVMRKFVETYQNEQNAIKGNGEKKKTFGQRILNFMTQRDVEVVQVYIKEVRALLDGAILSQLSEAEAAKRLAIGTRVGKLHSKAMKFSGLSTDTYKTMRDEFLQMMKENKLKPQTSQEPSVISLQTQKDVFLEPDFQEALALCDSQYELVEALPLVGHAVKIYRSDASRINPWLIHVQSVAKHHKVLDTVSMMGDGNRLKLKTGNNDEEYVNGVVPLFDEEVDTDLKPYISSKLFQVLMTFNVMTNVDTFYENAYFALLGNLQYYLMTQPESEWRNSLMELVRQTFKLAYGGNQEIKDYLKQLLGNKPELAMVTENPSQTAKCEDLAKSIFLLDYAVSRKLVTEPAQVEKIVQLIIREFFGRALFTDVNSFFELRVENEDGNLVDRAEYSAALEAIKTAWSNKPTTKFYTLLRMREALIDELYKMYKAQGKKVRLQPNMTYFNNEIMKLNLVSLSKVYMYFVGKDFDRSVCLLYLAHAGKYSTSYARNTNETSMDTAEIGKRFLRTKLELSADFDAIWPDLEDAYKKEFQAIHEQAYGHMKRLENTGVCLAPACAFYNQTSPSLMEHLGLLAKKSFFLSKAAIDMCLSDTLRLRRFDANDFQHKWDILLMMYIY
eukprot:TRINITY_DN3632_c0_g1_i2.p1 TRINITY_DN3632_c0_g1~~TRINITY_DN3632_c0_g1_i2.p1  ORF type:complete len:801 (+),score=200.79 TRINITY_DN3632_c0_g1_i2:442-2844(+)